MHPIPAISQDMRRFYAKNATMHPIPAISQDMRRFYAKNATMHPIPVHSRDAACPRPPVPASASSGVRVLVRYPCIRVLLRCPRPCPLPVYSRPPVPASASSGVRVLVRYPCIRVLLLCPCPCPLPVYSRPPAPLSASAGLVRIRCALTSGWLAGPALPCKLLLAFTASQPRALGC